VNAEADGLRGLGRLLDPSSLVLVGASERRADVVRTATKGVRAWLVNPRREEVAGRPCYPSVAALPEVPDVAMVLVGAATLEAAVSEALAAGVGGLVVPGLGAEAGSAGPAVARRVAALAEEHGVALLGVNCMGYARPEGPSPWLGTPSPTFEPGRVAVVSQSGSVAEALATLGRRVGFEVVISSGSEVSRDAADLVAHLASDERIGAIGLFLEAVRRPGAFAAALIRCAEAAKPVVCVKVGRSAAAAAVALTHTGAVVGSAVAFSAFLRAHGVIEVDDVTEMVEHLEVLGRSRRPKGARVLAVSESGGEAGLLADHVDAAGLELAALPPATSECLREEFPNFARASNPLDAWAVDDAGKVFPRAIELLGKSGAGDILVGLVELTRFRSRADLTWCAVVVDALVASAGVDIFPALISSTVTDADDSLVELARRGDVALLRGVGAAARALAAAARWSPRLPSPSTTDVAVDISDLLRPGALSEWESSQLLARYGVRFAPSRRAAGPDEAAAAAAELGVPVVVKLDGPAHKSRLGGVIVGVGSPEEAADAASRLGAPVLVAQQVPAGLEVLCGMRRDPDFGPVLSVGLGGRLAEAAGALASARLAPVDHGEAEAMVASVPGLAGDHGDIEAVAVVLGRLSRLAVEHPEVEAVDINPIIVGTGPPLAVDALVVIGSAIGGGSSK